MVRSGERAATEKDVLIERGHWKHRSWQLYVILLCELLSPVLPAVVISRAVPANIVTIPLAVAGYCLLVWYTADAVFRRVRLIYNPNLTFEPMLWGRRTSAEWRWQARFVVTFDLIRAYLYIAYIFALTYTVLSELNPKAFNVSLTLGAALYFSVTTIATVGYGDIAPASGIARAMAVTEILIGLLYAVLVFSVVAGHLQKRAE